MYALAKKIRPYVGSLKIGQIIEKKIVKDNFNSKYPPIFLIGLPRSGSTLLYQLMVHYFRTSYFSNIASLCYTYPATVTYFSQFFQKKYQVGDFESNFGFTPGMLAPSEAGAIYRFWFENFEQNHKLIERTSHKISNIFQAPLIWKNLNLSYEIDKLSQIFPNALFVLVERDLEYICQSIYRRTINGPGLGIKGLTKADLTESSDIMKSIVLHVKQANAKIFNSLKFADLSIVYVKYAELCNDNIQILNKISTAYKNNGYVLRKKCEFKKHKFIIDNYQKISDPKWERLIALLKNH